MKFEVNFNSVNQLLAKFTNHHKLFEPSQLSLSPSHNHINQFHSLCFLLEISKPQKVLADEADQLLSSTT
jgi:hypothetical protein